ncbi:hypothetical protein BJ875DRAFT_475560 [Amylocarpus encephaloides]|uniref:Zn(2)-C6 fungal-type domain-containing protein n=1 Tax=Amylocarpus encephaloides TaxID=45428 RepID=A0A9P7Y9F1_9HELO|nr:hypothetical protein BJ875DRAFT_475560 [Amylocarpus encephaloides]
MAMKPGVPAPYGRACLSCVQTKCKCITRAEGGCERCHRLTKDCQRPASSRRKSTRKLTTPTPPQISTPSSSDTLSNASSTKTPNSLSDIFCNQDLPILSMLEAEEYLNIFRTQKLQFLPFLHLCPSISAAQLQRERPFLWICIMAISVRSTTQQIEISRTVRLNLSRLMLLELEIDVDLLLGLLVFLAWTNCQIQGKQALSIFTQMAVSLVHDLGLNKSVENGYAEVFNLYSFGYQEPSKYTARTMEERRAVLGCFLVSSMASKFLQRLDTLKWTPYMDECLDVLIREKEVPADEIFVQQVKLQLIAERAVQVSAGKKDSGFVDTSKAPVAFYIKALQSQIEQVLENVDFESPSRFISLLHMHSTSLLIHGIGFSKTPIPSADDSNMQRIERLYASFNSAKSWLDIFLAIPTTAYVGFPFSIFAQLMRALVALFELSTLEDPAWDTSLVRGSTDVMLILDQIIANMQQAGSVQTMGMRATKENNFDRAAETFLGIRARWRLKLPEPRVNPSFIIEPGSGEVDQVPWNLPEHWGFSDIFTSWDH